MCMKLVLLIVCGSLTIVKSQGTGLECGKSSSMIMQLSAGTDSMVQAADWPWLAILWQNGPSGRNYLCAGSLVSESHVVTAAHCLKSTSRTLTPSQVHVKIGRNMANMTFVESRDVRKITIHPSFSVTKKEFIDLAVVTLDSPLSLTEKTTPVCVWNTSLDLPQEGALGTLVGSSPEPNGTSVKRLQLTRMRMVGLKECRASDPRFVKITSEDTLCAGNKDGFGPCVGFGGSGLFVLQGSARSGTFWSLRGVLTRSLTVDGGPCDLNQYFVFVDTAKLASWITSVVFKDTFTGVELSTEKTYIDNFSTEEIEFPSTYIIIASISLIIACIFIALIIFYVVKNKKCCMANHSPLIFNRNVPNPVPVPHEPVPQAPGLRRPMPLIRPLVTTDPAYLEMLEGSPIYDEIVERPESNFYDVPKEQAFYENMKH